jgi:hypothetical protein
MSRQCCGLSARNRRFLGPGSTSSRLDSRVNAVARRDVYLTCRQNEARSRQGVQREAGLVFGHSRPCMHANMVIRSHRAICLSSHTKGTPSARIIRTRRRLLYSRRSHTVHTLPASLMLVCFAANPKRISEWRISTAERKVQPLQYVLTFNSPCSCSSRKYSSATPITQITFSHDLGADLTYLLLPSCRPVRNLEQIAAAAAQRGSQDSSSLPVEPVSRQIPRSPFIPFSQPLAALGYRSWHGG